MSKIPSLTKTLTILGLIFQGVNLVFAIIFLLVLLRLPTFFILFLEEVFVTNDELNAFYAMLPWIRIIPITLVITQIAFIGVHLFLFIPLLQNKKSSEKASTLFLYQAIFGGINLFGNQIVGILYLVSGIVGRNHMEQSIEPTREGL